MIFESLRICGCQFVSKILLDGVLGDWRAGIWRQHGFIWAALLRRRQRPEMAAPTLMCPGSKRSRAGLIQPSTVENSLNESEHSTGAKWLREYRTRRRITAP